MQTMQTKSGQCLYTIYCFRLWALKPSLIFHYQWLAAAILQQLFASLNIRRFWKSLSYIIRTKVAWFPLNLLVKSSIVISLHYCDNISHSISAFSLLLWTANQQYSCFVFHNIMLSCFLCHQNKWIVIT